MTGVTIRGCVGDQAGVGSGTLGRGVTGGCSMGEFHPEPGVYLLLEEIS